MKQGTLGAFGGGGSDGERPDEEAAAVAGSDDGDATVVDVSEHRFPDADGHVECSVTQVDYTIEGRGDDEHPVLHVFGRDENRETVHIRVYGFKPYFYTPISELDLAVDAEKPLTDADIVDSRLDHDRLTGVETYGHLAEEGQDIGAHDEREAVVYESIRGEELVKVFGQTPRDVGELRDRFEHYEADILFPNRLLIDKDVTSGVRVPVREDDDGSLKVHHTELSAVELEADTRVHTLDIEVDDRHGFPEDGEQTIICLTSHDSYRDEYVIWLYESPEGVPGPEAVEGYDPLGDGEVDVDIRAFSEEADMLVDYLDYIDETDPDVLTGWNFDDFDAPYLIDRIDRLQSRHDRLESDRLSRVDEVWDSGWGGPNIKGRVVFDLLYAYQRTQFSELDSYRLDAVGEEELGVGKERYTGDIGDLWEDDPERLLEYNLRDVELCVELDRKQNIVEFWEEVASFVGCKLEDATTPGDAVDMYVLHEIHGEFALPSKGQQESEEYEGGAVFDPITGVKEMVSVLDLKSLYPMCMVTINASPETKVDPTEYDGETYVAPNGTHFRKEPDGMIREMVDELLTEREEKKGLRNEHEPGTDAYDTYDRQQAAVKVIMNSLYGVLGWDRFRLYDKEMGAAVTATGRDVIEFTESAAADLDKEVIYGDTDSIMLELEHDISKDEAIEQSFEIEEHINDAYDEFAAELNADEHRFQIEFEKLYRRFFQAGKKKRYAGHIIWKEGKDVDDLDITGFEYKRSDIAPITKEVQKQVLEMIVTGEDPEDIKDYVHGVIERVQAGDVSLDEIGIPGGIGKKLDNYDTDTAQVRGAKYANLLLGTNFASGSKPKRLYLKKVHPEFFREVESEMGLDPSEDPLYGEFKRDPDVICFEFDDQVPDAFEVDYEKMLEKTLKGPIARVLEALDISWEEVKSGQEQTGLGSYM
ncbi:DNA polymerase elongation subunit [Natronomonas halophila]|uniref:DNA-directed DNA polymerase n=1 Tax=Natronomonas halophila TaxID=2747817 RepID=UPI0015B5EE20|nr:DNA-directed DNA polymerase [Natronomonas halophila]QLD86624.1 DNA polymerase elongation subunit [Natronomonas halophila]